MTRVAGRRGGFPLLTTAFVSTLVPVLHAEIPVLCLPSHPMWPIVAGCRQITGLDPSCRRPILLFVALPFFSFTPHPLHTPLHTPSSSLVFVIDHPPLVHLSFPPLSLSPSSSDFEYHWLSLAKIESESDIYQYDWPADTFPVYTGSLNRPNRVQFEPP